MSSSSNFSTRRRSLLALALAAPMAPLAWAARPGAEGALLPELAGSGRWQRWGSGELRRWGILVYRATLWAADGEPLRPPYALELEYAIPIRGAKLTSTSLEEMRRLRPDSVSRLPAWGEQLARLFPDVAPGERIVGVHRPEGAQFFHQRRELGRIDDPDFADAFFANWLDPASRAADVRAALLRRRA